MSGGFRSRSRGGATPPNDRDRNQRGDRSQGGDRSHGDRDPRGPRGEHGERRQRGEGPRGDKPRGGRGQQPPRNGGRQEDSGRGGRPSPQRGRDRRPQRYQPYRGVDTARSVAFDVLHQVLADDAYANLVLPRLLTTAGLEGRDAAFATELTYGTLRQLGTLDRILDDLSTRPIDSLDVDVANALRLGLYQLLHTRVAAHAAVDSSVNLVKGCGQDRASGFTNGILRSALRAGADTLLDRARPTGEVAGLAFDHAHPEWIAASFARVLGMVDLAAALEADSERPQVHLAARPGEISAEELAATTGGEQGRFSPYAVYLPSGDPGDLPEVKERVAMVQDEGSQLIARALVEAPLEGPDGGRWLDLCAGPGGKTALIGAVAAIDGARVDAIEKQSHRARLVENACQQLPVTVHCADGRTIAEDGYDRVLVDAPCSGLGALRRRPEARWRKQEADIADLNPLQYQLLLSAIAHTRPGGVVVYSTCSPDLRETRGIVDKALAAGGVEELPAHEYACGAENLGDYPSVQLWPHRHGTDAMFFSLLRVHDPAPAREALTRMLGTASRG